MCFTLAAAPPGSWEEPHGSLQLRSKRFNCAAKAITKPFSWFHMGN